ncbi:Ribonuclease [Anatilimnocola aggregata]|uniref:Ribonuclease n=1 Tax=Anatilimnocola aggregata TaxID=2528021 RepID=A0A517YD60_9BACT|nr:MBL fold metallo-hydrolase [Anatilimnocola aggregata]QDU28062.1 Ribonuclease [Anatilimnocola aggregata]
MIKLGFYGAAGEVTGSCYVLTTDRARVMIDMGMHQGEREADDHNRRMPPIDPAQLDAVVLTHAHLDHCGRLPLLNKNGYRGRIHCTDATADVTAIILRDSAGIQAEDCLRFNRRLRRGEEPCQEPLYSVPETEQTLRQLSAVGYDQVTAIADGISIKFIDAGHILGAASVQMIVQDGSRTITFVFSGDVGVSGSPILRDPTTPLPADVVILESTYGDRDHKPLDKTRDELLAILKDAQSVGGKVLIPAFAVGRTQDLVFHIGEFLREGKLPSVRVYVDSPMATSVSDLYARHKDVYDERATQLLADHMLPLSFPGLIYTRTVEESKRLNETRGSMVIISARGMCTGGRIMHHLYHDLGNPETHVVIAGYQGQGTLGRRLVDGARTVNIFREAIPVRAKVHTLGGFSAHAGQSALLT